MINAFPTMPPGGGGSASNLSYTPTVPADWDGVITDGQEALDELADRVRTIENNPASAQVAGLTLFASPVVGEIGYASGNNTVSRAIATALASSRAVGVYTGTANTLSQGPRVGILLQAGLNAGTPPAAGQPIFVSASVAGRGTNVAPSAVGQVEAQVAILLDASGYNNATGSVQDCVWLVTAPIQL